MTCVGLIGGLGVGATVHYYEKIAAACKARGMVPDLVIAHADVDIGQGLVRAGKLDELADYLASFIERMARAGAEAAVIPAVTPHICIAQLLKRTRLPLINIVDPIGAELSARKIKRVALFGTVFTVEGGLWGQLAGVDIAKPRPDEIDFIGKAYQRILDTQAGNEADTAGLRRIAADLQRRDGVEAILLAGTDLAVIFDEETAGFPAIDVARLHIDAIVERLAA
ncbi:aspartate/glutamate racemase family protein [Reyranella sp.]|uniref:aspartate/glutamate racemase family protein n=1 Tax=Reyranella sp. TaxID=1929291 RepID=UPI002730FC31|nr:aspartate/glutamate racemase family protein [Reyranella sp.]MDP2378262.1 aspartate/glutamate racemase family protein [Reyranella sp.]